MPIISVPNKLKSDQFVQTILAQLEFQTNRAIAAEEKAKAYQSINDELRISRQEWKDLYSKEVEAHTFTRTALAEERASNGENKKAIGIFQAQRELDKQELQYRADKISQLKSSRWKWAAVSFLGGAATGAVFTAKF